jgi:hypothetical protein
VFREQSFQKSFRPAEACSFPSSDRFSEIEQATLRREIERSQCAGDAKAFSRGYSNGRTLVDQQQIGAKRFSKERSRLLLPHRDWSHVAL